MPNLWERTFFVGSNESEGYRDRRSRDRQRDEVLPLRSPLEFDPGDIVTCKYGEVITVFKTGRPFTTEHTTPFNYILYLVKADRYVLGRDDRPRGVRQKS
jgi:hypothetical protein